MTGAELEYFLSGSFLMMLWRFRCSWRIGNHVVGVEKVFIIESIVEMERVKWSTGSRKWERIGRRRKKTPVTSTSFKAMEFMHVRSVVSKSFNGFESFMDFKVEVMVFIMSMEDGKD